MIGLLVATHGKFASGLLDAAGLILGEIEKIDTIELTEGKDLDEFRNDYLNKIKALDSGKGVLVFVDLQNATPFNIAGSIMGALAQEGINIRVITGVNLPMLLETNFSRTNHESVETLYPEVLNTGKEGIVELREAVGL